MVELALSVSGDEFIRMLRALGGVREMMFIGVLKNLSSLNCPLLRILFRER